jgi:hypothetical protein
MVRKRHERAARIGRSAADAGRQRQRQHADDHEAQTLSRETGASEPADDRTPSGTTRNGRRAPALCE